MTCHDKSEEKCELKNPWSESVGFKCGTPIMLGPLLTNRIFILVINLMEYMKYFNSI